jgi:Indole-3-glycerol phosphate synthase
VGRPRGRGPGADRLASGTVTDRRLSQAIAEGDGISVLVEIGNGDAARRAQERGAEGVFVRGAHSMLGREIALPLLAYGPEPEDAAASAAAAVVLRFDDVEDDALAVLADRCLDLGLELVVRIRDDEELERVLEHLDPEILLLTAERAEPDQHALDRLLELLPDVPAGKLAIAELADASREDVEELERAGVDAVLVTGDVEALVGDGVPDV